MPNENFNLKNKNVRSLKYNISDTTQDIPLDNSLDPDSSYFNKGIKKY